MNKPRFNPDHYRAREKRVKDALDLATEEYRSETRQIREELAAELKRVRQASGVSMASLATATGLNRGVFNTAEEPSALRTNSVERLLELVEIYHQGVADLKEMWSRSPRPRRGRTPGHSMTADQYEARYPEAFSLFRQEKKVREVIEATGVSYTVARKISLMLREQTNSN